MIENPLGDIHRLFFRIGCFHVRDQLAGWILRPQRFAFAHFVMRNHCAGRGKNGLGRTIVLLELDDPDTRVVLFEREDVLDVGPAPAIYGLIFVSDHADIVVQPIQVADQPVLHAVRVLVFVHHDVLEARAVSLRGLRELVEQLHRLDQQIIEIECVRFSKTFLVLIEHVGRVFPRWLP